MKKSDARKIIAAIVKLRESVSDELALSVPMLYPAWREGVEYVVDYRVLYNDVLYKVVQTHVSQETWTPDVSPSLFAKVLIVDENVVPEWEQPDSTNPYMKGDTVTHNSNTWVSLVDNNVWEPTDAVPTLWEKQ